MIKVYTRTVLVNLYISLSLCMSVMCVNILLFLYLMDLSNVMQEKAKILCSN